MSDIPNPTPPAATPPDEHVSPEVSFVRGFLGRVSAILRADDDQKAKLQGPARLVAELLDNSGKVFLFKSEYEKLKSWADEDARLQKVHEQHTNVEADGQFFAQQSNLHASVNAPDFTHSQILSRDAWREKFQAIRRSAAAEQRRLWRTHISLARELAHRAETIVLQHANDLEISERENFTRYGLTYTGSPLVAACRSAAKTITARVALDESTGGPSACLPWLIL